jgi:hypothetical protein
MPMANRFSCAAASLDIKTRKQAEEATHNLSGRLIQAREVTIPPIISVNCIFDFLNVIHF